MAKKPKKRLTPKARREAVEAAIREQGWDFTLAQELAQKTGWSWRTIYRDRDALLDKLVAEEDADTPRRRAAFLADARTLRSQARRAGAYGPAARLLDMELRVQGLDRVRLPEVEDEDDGPVDTTLEGVLVETRRLRKRAMAGDSYVAAEKLLEREQELAKAITDRDEGDARKRRRNMAPEDIVSIIQGAAGKLPEEMRRELRIALGASE